MNNDIETGSLKDSLLPNGGGDSRACAAVKEGCLTAAILFTVAGACTGGFAANKAKAAGCLGDGPKEVEQEWCATKEFFTHFLVTAPYTLPIGLAIGAVGGFFGYKPSAGIAALSNLAINCASTAGECVGTFGG